MATLTEEKKLEILKKVKDLAKKNYQKISEKKDSDNAKKLLEKNV